VARLTGVREFWSLPFRVTPDTLEPRPDSETVVEAALAALDAAGVPRQRPLGLLDLGTGTGCLLLALLRELPAAWGLGVDISPGACAAAAANARSLGLARRARFRPGDWGRGLDGGFDLVVANPPYVSDGEIATLQPEVALHEPRSALAGGPDGLAGHRALAPHVARLLGDGGVAVVEFGAGPGSAHGPARPGRDRTLPGAASPVNGARTQKKWLENAAVPSSLRTVEAPDGPNDSATQRGLD
jgi:release factor glutamine methyltransferase